MRILKYIPILVLLSYVTVYSQLNHSKRYSELSNLLDEGDVNHFDYMGFQKSNPIYERVIPQIIVFLAEAKNSREEKMSILNRWFKSQQLYANGLSYQYGRIEECPKVLSDSLLLYGISFIPQPMDMPKVDAFAPSLDYFLKYSRNLKDTVLTSFLELGDDGYLGSVEKIIGYEKYINMFPQSFYTAAVWNKYTRQTTYFLSNNYGPNFGGETEVQKLEYFISVNRSYLDKAPNGFIAPMVRYNLGQLLNIQDVYIKETREGYQQQMIWKSIY